MLRQWGNIDRVEFIRNDATNGVVSGGMYDSCILTAEKALEVDGWGTANHSNVQIV
ncbi:hypothetical protein FHS15_004746 [Paenibacillus castaneae]|uniref:hypothetical protein n=1 Tax=Paenibacillus castaneae TaxID=474957 RepID=UPI00141A7563|nr:hypothetical protein [Paenibacillus castaneae]NIK79585.1 hypothetical protein [Paenibacillus castaneae]